MSLTTESYASEVKCEPQPAYPIDGRQPLPAAAHLVRAEGQDGREDGQQRLGLIRRGRKDRISSASRRELAFMQDSISWATGAAAPRPDKGRGREDLVHNCVRAGSKKASVGARAAATRLEKARRWVEITYLGPYAVGFTVRAARRQAQAAARTWPVVNSCMTVFLRYSASMALAPGKGRGTGQGWRDEVGHPVSTRDGAGGLNGRRRNRGEFKA
jgi:hypothetical protein